MKCAKCGKVITGRIYPDNSCQGCYKYFSKGGTENPLPPLGVVKHDKRGYVICHICGRAYRRLGSHIKESHEMSIKEYKEKFGLCDSAKTTEEGYSSHMKKLAYENGMDKWVVEIGKNTRFKPGDERIKTRNVRLQERLAMRDRMKKKVRRKEAGDVIEMIDYNMQNKILHSDFDVATHKKYFVNYLEVVILENGKVEYAIPSHQEKLVSIAAKKLGKTREDIVDMCPKEYYLDYNTWLSKISGAISVWNEFYQGEANEKQIKTLRELREAGLYHGDIVIKPAEYEFNIKLTEE